jgi:hypothetical protein
MGIRRRRQDRRAPVSPAARHVLLTGKPPTRDMDGFWDAMIKLGGVRAQALWCEHQDDLLAYWISTRPGCRPAAWWQWTATEPRQLVAGAGRVTPWAPDHWEYVWRGSWGLLHTTELDLDDPPYFESQPAYLRRLRLLSPDEARRLRPDAYEPEAVQLVVADWLTPPKVIGYLPFPAEAEDDDRDDEEETR